MGIIIIHLKITSLLMLITIIRLILAIMLIVRVIIINMAIIMLVMANKPLIRTSLSRSIGIMIMDSLPVDTEWSKAQITTDIVERQLT